MDNPFLFLSPYSDSQNIVMIDTKKHLRVSVYETLFFISRITQKMQKPGERTWFLFLLNARESKTLILALLPHTSIFYFLSKVNPRWLSLMILPQAGNRQVLKLLCFCSRVMCQISIGLFFVSLEYLTLYILYQILRRLSIARHRFDRINCRG